MKLWSVARFKCALIPALLVGLVGCAGGGPTSERDFPSLDFTCNESQVSSCASALGRKAFLGLTRNTVANCSLLMGTLGLATLHQNFDYSSQTDVLADGADGVWGRFQSYFDQDGAPAPTLASGFYRVCGFIDANYNGYLDSGEPFLNESWNPNLDLNRLFEAWSPAP